MVIYSCFLCRIASSERAQRTKMNGVVKRIGWQRDCTDSWCLPFNSNCHSLCVRLLLLLFLALCVHVAAAASNNDTTTTSFIPAKAAGSNGTSHHCSSSSNSSHRVTHSLLSNPHMATLVEAPEDVVASLERKVVDAATSLPEKYRVLFSLRNVAGTAATKALITGRCQAQVLCILTALHT